MSHLNRVMLRFFDSVLHKPFLSELTIRRFPNNYRLLHTMDSCRQATADSSPEGGAFMERLDLSYPDADGPLKGYSVIVKDSYDIQGYYTGNGSPEWRETHPLAVSTAPAVERLLKAGARVVGKAVMDEMAYSIEGQNHHYGTPVNPRCVDRIPGGSSSGTASAVASSMADFGLGGDTGGSVRIPASFCGLYGIRPTHGRIDIQGSCPLAPSFDTVGLFARDAALLKKASCVLLQGSSLKVDPKPLDTWLVGTDAFTMCSEGVSMLIYEKLSPHIQTLREMLSKPVDTVICKNQTLSDWFDVFRICQAWEIWQTHGDWIQTNTPSFGPGIRERFDMASKVTREEFEIADKKRSDIRQHLDDLLEHSLLMIPTASGPAPLRNLPVEEMVDFRSRTLALTSIAGLAGLPQVTIPIATKDDCPIGLSILGPRGSDEILLDLAIQLESILQ